MNKVFKVLKLYFSNFAYAWSTRKRVPVVTVQWELLPYDFHIDYLK